MNDTHSVFGIRRITEVNSFDNFSKSMHSFIKSTMHIIRTCFYGAQKTCQKVARLVITPNRFPPIVQRPLHPNEKYLYVQHFKTHVQHEIAKIKCGQNTWLSKSSHKAELRRGRGKWTSRLGKYYQVIFTSTALNYSMHVPILTFLLVFLHNYRENTK